MHSIYTVISCICDHWLAERLARSFSVRVVMSSSLSEVHEWSGSDPLYEKTVDPFFFTSSLVHLER